MCKVEREVSGRSSLVRRIRPLVGMIVLMWGLGFTPLFALMLVPARLGELKQERLTGAEAENYLESKISSNPARRAAYAKAAERLHAKGKTRSAVVVVRTYTEPVPQTALRRFAEAIVPTLYARQYYQELTWDDWSGYDQYYDGTLDSFDGCCREAQLLVSFNKDPETDFATATSEVIWYSGWEPDAAPTLARHTTGNQQGTGIRDVFQKIAGDIVHAAYPTLCAARISKSWWDRLNDWSTCAVSWCSGAATYCLMSNVGDLETLWAPCFTATCGGAEVSCAVSAILQD